MSAALSAFIRRSTTIASPPLLPEIRLHLATEITPIWEATEIELDRAGIAPPFWAFCWAGGQALARHVLDRADLVRGKTVLDFAAGGGAVGIAAARAGAARICAYDIDACAVAACGLNAALNDVTLDATTAAVAPGSFDVVLAGDICYERAMTETVLPDLRAAAAAGATVLIGDPGRAYLPKDGLCRLAQFEVPTTRELEDRELRTTTIWRLKADA